MYDLELGIFFNSRDVVFCENEFPFAARTTSLSDARTLSNPSFVDIVEDDAMSQDVPNMHDPFSTLAAENLALDDHDGHRVVQPAPTDVCAADSSLIESPIAMQPAVEARGDHLTILKIWDVAIVPKFPLPGCGIM